MTTPIHTLKIKDLGIDTYRENIVFIRSDSHICKSEGFTALTRVVIHKEENKLVATLNMITSDLLEKGELSLSQEAMKRLNVKNGDQVTISHLHSIESCEG